MNPDGLRSREMCLLKFDLEIIAKVVFFFNLTLLFNIDFSSQIITCIVMQ